MSTDYILRIAVCDDQQTDRSEIMEKTAGILQGAGLRYEMREYANGQELLTQVQKGIRYDIMLLDVMMDEMTGMELAAQLRCQGNKTTIVFISSNREMALCGYEVNAARFLAKPLDVGRLREALEYCVRQWKEKREILLPTERGSYRTPLSQIQYVEAFDRGTRFVLSGETVETKLKFGEVEAMLPETIFVLCHRAYMVNLAEIKCIRRYEFTLKSGLAVPIGKGRYMEIHRKFMDYIAD